METTETKPDMKNKIFFAFVILLVLGVVFFTYYQIVVLKNYLITDYVTCDPANEKCFVYSCDPVSDPTCSTNPDEQIVFYKEISKMASSIAFCQESAEKLGCFPELSCIPGEEKCSYRDCDSGTILNNEQCAE